MSALARKGKVDIRGDEEQNAKLVQIISLLCETGYHRARIKGLSPFDKLVGGMAWCIEACNVDIDVDLLFHDSLSIGQKISLTERIVKVLPSMKCPYLVEPHQIQGLDAIHVYPVVKWLVELAAKTRKEYQNEIRIISLNEFTRQYGQNSLDFNSSNVDYIQKIKRKFEVDGNWKHEKNPESSNTRNHLIAITPQSLSQVQTQVEAKKKDLEYYENKLLEEKRLKSDLKKELSQLVSKFDEVSKIFQNCKLFEADGSMEYQDVLNSLLIENEQYKERMSQFKSDCLDEEAVLQNTVRELEAQLKEPVELPDASISEEHEKELKNLNEYESKLASINRRIYMLKKSIDDLPGRAELAQYQKRFVELYNQVSWNHHETQQFNNLFNTVCDTKAYMEKEISLLNSISDNMNRDLDSSNVLLEFTRQLKVILENVGDTKRKLEDVLLEANQSKDTIKQDLSQTKSLQAHYENLLNQLSLEIKDNEVLANKIESKR